MGETQLAVRGEGETAWAAGTYLGEGWRQPWGIVLYNRHERLQRVHRRVGRGAERHLNRGDAKRPDVCLHGGHRSSVHGRHGRQERPNGAPQRVWPPTSTGTKREASVGLDLPAASTAPPRHHHDAQPRKAKRHPTTRPPTPTSADPLQANRVHRPLPWRYTRAHPLLSPPDNPPPHGISTRSNPPPPPRRSCPSQTPPPAPHRHPPLPSPRKSPPTRPRAPSSRCSPQTCCAA